MQVYSINWYEWEDNTIKMSLKFLIMRSQRSINFNAGGFIQINMATLVMVSVFSLKTFN